MPFANQCYVIDLDKNENTEMDKIDERGFFEVIFKDDGYIVGYGLLKAVLFYENEMPFGYNLSVLRSIVFPKVNNKHQNISEEYVLMQLEKYKN